MSKAHYGMNEETRAALAAIAGKHGFTLERLRERGKFQSLCEARRECYRYLWHERGWSTPQIGALFNRDHTTVVLALDNRGTAARKAENARRWLANRRNAGMKPLGARRVG